MDTNQASETQETSVQDFIAEVLRTRGFILIAKSPVTEEKRERPLWREHPQKAKQIYYKKIK